MKWGKKSILKKNKMNDREKGILKKKIDGYRITYLS